MNTLKLYILDLGRMRMDQNLIVSESIIADTTTPQKYTQHTEFPVQAFLFSTEKGYILYDTGCHPEAMGKNGRWPQEFQNKVPYFGDRDCTVLARLKQLGLTPKDIHTVILSHLHNDHGGCIEFFPDAQFIVHQDEFDAALRAYATHSYMSSYIWQDINAWTKKNLHWNFITREDEDQEIFPGLKILNLGSGHARGMLGIEVQLANAGAIILSSDALYCRENYEAMREPGVVYDTIGWRRSAKRIHTLATAHNAQVWFGHDLEQFATLTPSTAGYYD